MKHLLEYLRHMKDECEYLMENLEGLSQKEFMENETLKRAFVRSLEIIGEAAKKIPEEFRRKYPHMEWKEMAGMRDVLIHGYFGINYNIVWDVVNNHIPPLLKDIDEIIETNEGRKRGP